MEKMRKSEGTSLLVVEVQVFKLVHTFGRR